MILPENDFWLPILSKCLSNLVSSVSSTPQILENDRYLLSRSRSTEEMSNYFNFIISAPNENTSFNQMSQNWLNSNFYYMVTLSI